MLKSQSNKELFGKILPPTYHIRSSVHTETLLAGTNTAYTNITLHANYHTRPRAGLMTLKEHVPVLSWYSCVCGPIRKKVDNLIQVGTLLPVSDTLVIVGGILYMYVSVYM